MKGDSVSNSTDGPDIDEERVYRTVLVKSLPPSTSKQNLTIHFQSRNNGGGDIEELRLLDRGSAVITFEEEKVAKSVQKKEQRFKGVLLAVEQYNVQQEEMENLQVFSKVSAMIDPTKLGLTMQETQSLLKEIREEIEVDIAKPQNKRDVFILTGSFQQIQKSHRLLFHNCLSKVADIDSKREETSILKGQPKGMMNGKECHVHMNGSEELKAKSASKKVNGRAKTTSNHFSKSSGETQGLFKISTPNEKANGPKGGNGLSSGEKDKSENRMESSISSKEETDCTQKVEISSKAWYVFVKIYEKELQSVMTNFSVQIEPEDNHSVAIIKPSGEYNKEKLKMAGEELKRLYEEASSKMTLVRFVLADPENREHDSTLRKTVLQVKKDSPVFLERADDRQSWEIFGEIDQVEKGMKLLEENVKLERKEQNIGFETIDEADSEEESDDADKQNSDTATDVSSDDVDEDDDDFWNEKLEQQLGKVKVSVYRGDITEEKCDAIVNAANESLDHGGGVARTIVSKGGPAIQDACNRIVNSKGKLNVGDAAVSPSGSLKCKMIIHAVGPNWKNDKGEKGKALLKKACEESLFQAEKYRFESIAFPAISSGIFGMPKRICAQVMFDVAEEYSNNVTSSDEFRLRDIRFVNNDVKTVKTFRNEFKTRYGSGKVIPEKRRDRMESGGHSAYTMSENPPASMRGNSKPFNISPNWKAESNKEATIKPKTNAFEPTKDSDKIPSRERHSSSQENGLSLAPRGGRPVKEDPSRPLADKMGKPSRHFQTGRGKGAHIEYMEKESRNPSHSSKHAVAKSYSFTGGARPKESQSQYSKHKTHTEHLLASSASIETKEDANKCSICLSKMKHPQTLPKCNHTFCKTCLEKAIQRSPKCPYCREPLTDRQDSPTHGQGTNGYRGDEFAYSGLDRYDDDANDATLCLLCAKPVRNAKTLPCRHTFCGPCIDKAFRAYPACPCCSELERNQPSTHSWNQDPYDQLFSYYPQGSMDMDVPQGRFPPAFRREQPRSNRGNRPPYAQNFDDFQQQFSFPGSTTRSGRPGRGTQPEGSMRVRQEKFSLPGYEEYETIVIQYSFKSGQQGPDHPNPGFRYESTSRSAYLPDCPEGRKVLKLLRKAFDAGLLFKIGRSMTSNLDNQIIWADIPHKTSTSGGQTNYGYPDPTYLSDVKQQLQAALKGR